MLFFAVMLTVQYEGSWTAAERLYLSDYLKSGTRGKASAMAASKYTLLEAVIGKGQRLVIGDEVEPVMGPDGRPGYRLTDEGVKDGIARLTWVTGVFNNRGLHRLMSQAVYADHESWEFYRKAVYLSLAFFVLALFVAVPKDRKRRTIWKHGRRLRGPELVTTAEFNEKLGKSKLLTTHLPDGIALINEEGTWWDKLFHKNLSRWARVPRDREAMHFLIVGDSGTGKSAAIRQMLSQVWERGEAAIVYDPAMEYLPQFYDESRGDVILNPMDARCPFWTPGDEVPHEAEALTLAVSLFPDQGRENRFFVEAPRKIFAHLINLKPTPEQLTYWMSNADEIDKRIEGTEMAAMIDRGAANQRSGVLGSLNMVADAFKLLPKESETTRRWSTVEWAKERKGWVFLTSKPTMRERMRPLISLWLDLLVLRLMNDDTARRKTTSLAAVREAAVRAGYEVEGLAPTSRAAQKLGEAGMATETLQRHLTRGDRADDGQRRLYVVDESSMASTRQMHTFVERLKENDRVLFVGDTRQHEAVEAGRPYAQLQEAGLRTAHLDEIIRQKDPALKEAVEQLARGEVRVAIGNLNSQGRVHEIGDRHERIAEIAREYVRSPESTLVVSPDNESRREINQHIHRAMQGSGQVKGEEHQVAVLYARQDITGADRQHAQNYEQGDVIRYSKGSKPLGIEAGEYARVARVDKATNTVTVARKSGEELSYDPRRLQGVTVYRETERAFAEGDRVQMTAPYHEQKLANRELGTVDKIDGDGNLKLRMDSGREVEFNTKQHPHLDYGYAVTSHSSQGQTADRVLIHVDSSQAHGELLNSRMAYVSVSRAQYDLQMYTNDAKTLGHELSRDVSHPSAIQQTSDPAAMQQQTPIQQDISQQVAPQPVGMELSRGHGLGL
jgi:hypothetical protein